MDDCIFCKIISKDLPSYTLYEDEHTLSFLDAFPGVKGHALVIPKQHFKSMFDTPLPIYVNVMQTVHKMAKVLKSSLSCDGLTCTQLNGKASGQTVFHLHFHLLPRWHDDGVIKIWKPLKKEPSDFIKLQKTILGQL